MKHVFTTLVTSAGLVAALLATPGFAATPVNSWYAGASGDVTWMGDSDTGGGANVDIGYRFRDWRVEGEVGYHDASGNDGENYWTYMGNAYYDFNNIYAGANGWQVSPYLGAGVGSATIDDESEFAYQGMAGLNFTSASTPNTTYRLGYRYLGAADNSPEANNIELGVNVAF